VKLDRWWWQIIKGIQARILISIFIVSVSFRFVKVRQVRQSWQGRQARQGKQGKQVIQTKRLISILIVSGGSHIIAPCKFLDEVKALGATVEAEED
jgi:hypothetical protein